MPGDVGNLIGLRRRSRGNTFLLSRAKDANGEVQPDKHDENYATYVEQEEKGQRLFTAPPLSSHSQGLAHRKISLW